jgi:uncharacterized protein
VQLEQAFEVAYAGDAIWRWFHDIEGVVECLPGASLRAPPDHGALQLSMVIKLGPITATFVGDGEVRFDDAARSGTVSGSATDRKNASRIKGTVSFSLIELIEAPILPATRVELVIDYTMGGTLAQFSREGIVRDLAQRLTDAFAGNLRRRLEAARPHGDTVVAAPIVRDGSPGTNSSTSPLPIDTSIPSTKGEAPALNVGALLWSALMDRLRRLLGKRPHA